MKAADGRWERPTGEAATRNDDTMLIYFSSGTTGQPKMVAHDFTYPLGHIVTASSGRTCAMADCTTRWRIPAGAKSAWGKLYGQWICGSAVFVHDYDKFSPTKNAGDVRQIRCTTFCAPPTVYRFLIKKICRNMIFPNWNTPWWRASRSTRKCMSNF